MLKKSKEEEKPDLEDLVRLTFCRCGNFPGAQSEVLAMAQAVGRAAKAHGLTAEEIVSRCASLSAFCPTDYDIGVVAREIATARLADQDAAAGEAKRAQWRREAAPEAPVDADGCTCDRVPRCTMVCERNFWQAHPNPPTPAAGFGTPASIIAGYGMPGGRR